MVEGILTAQTIAILLAAIIAAFTLREMVVTRQEAAKPIIFVVAWDFRPPGPLEITLRNVGTGPAFDVCSAIRHARVWDHRRTWIGANEDVRLHALFPAKLGKNRDIDRPALEAGLLASELVTYYSDQYGRKWSCTTSIDLDISDASMQAERLDLHEGVEQIPLTRVRFGTPMVQQRNASWIDLARSKVGL